jgi:hypothetical protein
VIDRREIVWAGYVGRAELAQAPLSPLLRLYLAHPARGEATPARRPALIALERDGAG